MLQAIIAILIALATASSDGTTPDQFYEDNCWEDEVVVFVVHDPYDIAGSELACVPGDNMPWDPDGFRP